jgi:XTP/dITP diphosphohydrolase
MMKRLLVATLNPGKLREFSTALVDAGLEVLGLESITDRPRIEESGATFEENARLKAEGYSRHTHLPVLADDSGLEVEALGGAPGVKSARYGGAGLDDEGRNRKLLEALTGVAPERRTARFRCVLALAESGTTLATFEGVIEGRILDEPRGRNGFGYDPLFYHLPSGCTTAEMTTAEKQCVSHRGMAIAAFLDALRQGDPRLVRSG